MQTKTYHPFGINAKRAKNRLKRDKNKKVKNVFYVYELVYSRPRPISDCLPDIWWVFIHCVAIWENTIGEFACLDRYPLRSLAYNNTDQQ